jgi:hypothetical protein
VYIGFETFDINFFPNSVNANTELPRRAKSAKVRFLFEGLHGLVIFKVLTGLLPV